MNSTKKIPDGGGLRGCMRAGEAWGKGMWDVDVDAPQGPWDRCYCSEGESAVSGCSDSEPF